MNKIILASRSNQRLKILKCLGFNVEVITVNVDEKSLNNEDACELVFRLSREKLKNITYKRNIPIISADTVINVKNKIFGKPINEEESFNILKILSGREHFVFTGLSIRFNKLIKTKVVKTKITFRNLSDHEILSYIKNEETLDKAGVYSI